MGRGSRVLLTRKPGDIIPSDPSQGQEQDKEEWNHLNALPRPREFDDFGRRWPCFYDDN